MQKIKTQSHLPPPQGPFSATVSRATAIVQRTRDGKLGPDQIDRRRDGRYNRLIRIPECAEFMHDGDGKSCSGSCRVRRCRNGRGSLAEAVREACQGERMADGANETMSAEKGVCKSVRADTRREDGESMVVVMVVGSGGGWVTDMVSHGLWWDGKAVVCMGMSDSQQQMKKYRD
ncbi:hypothetical protein IF1G_05302 [Cordyceps javanica]|uniref:Uncharacterized protein n=1 Tax=Cordyceps javanica TaxID=43265 RepID=A0A545V1A8_9HYPO|nr:hypothetical protein IF1G_05302 [Cordyceps javanica]